MAEEGECEWWSVSDTYSCLEREQVLTDGGQVGLG